MLCSPDLWRGEAVQFYQVSIACMAWHSKALPATTVIAAVLAIGLFIRWIR